MTWRALSISPYIQEGKELDFYVKKMTKKNAKTKASDVATK